MTGGTLLSAGRRTATPTTSGVVCTLHPGDVAFATRGDRLETLLGSCVAIVLTDPRRSVGVMCHIVHAKPGSCEFAASAAYAGVAIESMYRLLAANGITPRLCEAYVYGGGNMFPDLVQRSNIGDENANWAFDALAADGIRVLDHDVGGRVYRRLRWTVGHDAPRVVAVAV